jgi:hypothetical protein
MKKNPKDEEKILAEIRRRVIEHEQKHHEKLDHESNLEAHLQALDEMSGLDKDQIARIAYQVRKEHEAAAQKRRRRTMLAVALGLGTAVVGGGVANWQRAQQQKMEARHLHETFDSNQRGWSTYNELKYDRKIENGAYVLQIGDANCYWDILPVALPDHYAVELASVWQGGEKKSEYGLGLVAQDISNMLIFNLFPTGETNHGHYRNNAWEKSSNWSKVMANLNGNENVQRVEIKGNRSFRYLINGNLAWEDTFSRTVPAQVAMRSCDRQTVAFKSLKIINLSNNQVIFSDNFDSAVPGRWSPKREIGKVSSLAGGRYLFETNTEGNCAWDLQPFSVKPGEEYDIILKMSHVKGEKTHDFGLMLLQNSTDFYSFDYKANGKAWFNVHQGEEFTYTSGERNIGVLSEPGKPPVTLKIELRQDNCKYYINDKLIETFNLKPELTIQQLALRCCGLQQVAFDELEVIPK